MSGAVTFALWKSLPADLIGESVAVGMGGGEEVVASGAMWFSSNLTAPSYKLFQGISFAVGAGASVLPVDVRVIQALTQTMNWKTGRFDGGTCGKLGTRPCWVLERVPSCDLPLHEDISRRTCKR